MTNRLELDGVGEPARQSRRAVLGVTIMLLCVAVFESRAPVAQDDFGYLMWGLQTRGNPVAWLSGPDWVTYRRPLNALVWWLSAQQGIDGELARWSLVGLWTAFGTAIAALARPSLKGLGTLLLLLLTNQVFIDLLTWRSWITTAGSLAFLALGALAIERRASRLTVAIPSAITLGFKEIAAVALALRQLVRPGYRALGAFLVVALFASATSSVQKLGFHFVPENVRFHLETLALFAPAVPALLAARFPRLPGRALAITVVLAALPTPIRAAAFVVSAGLFVVRQRRWLPAAIAAFTLPLLGAAHARQYLLEGWAVLVLALAAGQALSERPVVWLAMLALGARPAIDFENHRMDLRDRFAKQVAFLHDFKPESAQHLYQPDPMGSWDLDTLYWVREGASMDGQPPPGTEPVQVGPLSGVWADVRPIQGSGSR
jgi:hypothetical protein